MTLFNPTAKYQYRIQYGKRCREESGTTKMIDFRNWSMLAFILMHIRSVCRTTYLMSPDLEFHQNHLSGRLLKPATNLKWSSDVVRRQTNKPLLICTMWKGPKGILPCNIISESTEEEDMESEKSSNEKTRKQASFAIFKEEAQKRCQCLQDNLWLNRWRESLDCKEVALKWTSTHFTSKK